MRSKLQLFFAFSIGHAWPVERTYYCVILYLVGRRSTLGCLTSYKPVDCVLHIFYVYSKQRYIYMTQLKFPF